MANRFKGEATAKLDGETYTLRCDFNAMCAFEDETGLDALDVFEKLEVGGKKAGINIRTLRLIIWSFMLHHHPDATLEQAGGILSENMDVLAEIIKASSPTSSEVGDLGNGKPKSRKKPKAA
jgi:hypothetical protein